LLEDTSGSTRTIKVNLAKNRNTAYLLALGIPLVAVVFYLKVGSPQGIISAATQAPETMGVAGGERSQQQIAANVQKLADRLKANPSDAAGWTMLARSYSSMERFGEAAGAYANATELNPNDADLWAEYAFVTAMANNQNFDGKATELVNHALKIDPENAKALQLSGSAAFAAKDYKKAIELWQRVLAKVPPGSEEAQAITERINEAKNLSTAK
jgi:cytochrome c-type biogenesis protein CcmH